MPRRRLPSKLADTPSYAAARMALRWYFDFVSPFSYLHRQRLRTLPQFGRIEAVPILFGALMDERGIRAPASLPGKRLFIYRQAQWQAERDGIALHFPPAHPFNPLPALRLCLAAGASNQAIDRIFEHIWRHGLAADSAQALAPLARALGIEDVEAALAAPGVKAALRANTAQALAAGVFGVPTLEIDGELFWGNDSHALMQAVLDDPALLQRGQWARLAGLPEGLPRTT